MEKNSIFFENAKIVFIGNQNIAYKKAVREEKILILSLGKKQGIAKILVGQLKGEKHINENLVNYPNFVKVEAFPVTHDGEEALYKAQRILLLDKDGIATAAFT